LPSHENPDNFVRNTAAVGPLEGFSAHLVVDEAIDWLSEKRDPGKPFFLFVCFHEPHEPIASARRYRGMYPSPGDPSRADHHGNVTQMDDALGRLMESLDNMQLRENTLVVFTSDNGPAITNIHPHGSSGGLREKKGYLYEGGIRVPGIVRWPGRVKPGSVSHEPVCGVDLLPTLCELTRTSLPADRAIDGTSLLPLLDNKPIQRETPLYWQFNFSRGAPKVAMRVGDWKILGLVDQPEIKPTGDIRPEDQQSIKHVGLASFELYNLRDDPGETNDLAQAEPEQLRRFAGQLRRMYDEVRQESPVWPEWTWPRYEGQRINAAKKAGIWPIWVREEVKNPGP
jgi:arylsulfatase A